MTDIFISYAREDRAIIEKLASTLESEGYSVWWDRRLVSGAEYSAEIEDKLNKAKIVITAWSSHAITSPWVRDEAAAARDAGKLAPITLDGTTSPMGFRQYHVVDFTDWVGDGNAPIISELKQAIDARIERETASLSEAATRSNSPSTKWRKMAPLTVFGLAGAVVVVGTLLLFTRSGAPTLAETIVAHDVSTGQQLPSTQSGGAGVINDGQSPPFVAVLPFKSSGSDDGGFLATGLHDDLLTRLAKLNAFKVISRTSMLEYAETTKNMRQIGEELGAQYILEGGVQALGERVRINAQLINAAADEHIWAETFDRELTAKNLFDIQAELAFAIASEMKTALSPEDKAVIEEIPTDNIEAYNAYLRGLRFDEESGPTGIKASEAIAAYEEAVRLDPGFALAWARMALTFTEQINRIYETDEDRDKALNAIARARALAPDLLETELAWIAYVYRGMGEFEQALDLLQDLENRFPPNASLMELRALLLRRVGRFDDGYKAMVEADRLSPRSLRYSVGLIWFAVEARNCEAAAEHVRFGREHWPDIQALRNEAAKYEMNCTGNLDRANELLKNADFKDASTLWLARTIAFMRRDFERAYELGLIPYSWDRPAAPVWELLTQATLLDHLDRPRESAAALEQAEAMIVSLDDDAIKQLGSNYAKINAWLNAINGNAAETLRWIEEEKRLIAASRIKNDRSEVALYRNDHAFFLASVGLHDEAIEELRMMLEAPGGVSFIYVDASPSFDELKDHPNYFALRERFGPKN